MAAGNTTITVTTDDGGFTAQVDVLVKEKEEPVKKGWIKEDGVWYYYDDSGALMTGWQLIGRSY